MLHTFGHVILFVVGVVRVLLSDAVTQHNLMQVSKRALACVLSYEQRECHGVLLGQQCVRACVFSLLWYCFPLTMVSLCRPSRTSR